MIPYYQVDVFTNQLFRGNPAGVCLLPADWLADEVLQNIAFENNLSETAFIVSHSKGCYGLRWFTPSMEMDLCGHATVAPAHILFTETRHETNQVSFETKSGLVSVERKNDRLILDFPSRPPEPCEPPANLAQVLGKAPLEVWRSRDYLVVFRDEDDIRSMEPDFEQIREWDCLGVIVTAPGKTVDFVSRFFAPGAGVNEDPVTGSAHSTLIPYWAKRLNKKDLDALQLSARGGELFCQDMETRDKIGGKAVTYFRGEIDV